MLDLRDVMKKDRFAVVGNTLAPEKYAYKIKEELLAAGYTVHGVGYELETLDQVPGELEVVDLCIRPERDAALHKDGAAEKTPFWKKHEKIWSTYVCLFVCYVANEIGEILAGFSGGFITTSIWCLILGCLAAQIGIVPPKILDKAKSSGFFMVLVYVSIIASLATISFSDLVDLSVDLVLIFGAVIIATFVFLYVLPGWKIVGSKNLAVGIAMAQLLGYPATYMITQEIAHAVGETDEEVEAISARIEPAYVLAGFATVTSFSIVIAGFFVNLL